MSDLVKQRESDDAAVTLPGGGPINPSEIFNGRGLFILGATGFVGKVALAMLLQRYPQVRRVYVMVRRGAGTDSESRFWNSVVTSPVFDPLREEHGGSDALETFLREKVRVVDGDITETDLGMTADEAQRVADDIDVVLNSSGRVTFNPPIESAMRTNVQGTRNVIDFVKRMKRPALVHTSTCFVAGNRSGEVWESERLDGYFPRHAELPGTVFSVEQEVKDVERIAAEVRAQAKDAQVMARLRTQARKRLMEQSRDPDDEGTLRLAIARERKDWVRSESTERGMARAAEWGWPNIYTYTKSMGDQLVARETEIFRSIVRPAIVESSLSYPFPGWNEGFTTSAPLVYLSLKGQHLLPVDKRLILDIVPVDHVAAGMLMVSAQCIVEQPKMVHQLSSGDLNPSRMDKVTTLTGLYKRKRLQERDEGNKFLNDLMARMELRGVDDEEYNRFSLPQANRIASRVSKTLGRARPSWAAGRFGQMIDRAKHKVDEVARITEEAQVNVDLFRPFIRENAYVFRADNIRAVRERMPASEQHLLDWSPEALDWYDYFLNVHFPGLQRWVLPELDKTYAPQPKSIYAYRDLIELFDTVTKLHGTRVAMRMKRSGRDFQYTYDNLRELADRAGAFLLGSSIGSGDRVMLFAKNAPEWSMSYFGILKAGATAVPVAHESTVDELVNIARASGAKGLIVGDGLLAELPELPAALESAGLKTTVWPFSEVFAIGDQAQEDARKATFPRVSDADSVASLIFTSGTTGSPKGVMLTHRNLTFMVAELIRVFEFGANDGVLSVLPLHHTFEFSAGLLVPLSRGAGITYLPELNGEEISTALKGGHVTAIVGVPALWELLKRRVLQKFTDRSPVVGKAVEALLKANYELRARTGVNLGVLFFFPVHEGFGGRIKYLISGGSSLPADVLETFYGLGFDFFEGYGLTETAPVLTVTSPKGRPRLGSVGKPLSGVEVKIDDPDSSGVGEVVARGRNVMKGYWEDEASTAQAIRDGWFRTGDLGRFDSEGHLHLVGRSKDIIVDANGKNVYPDELEELYKESPFIKELSIVGLPEGKGERVACAVVADLKHKPELEAEKVKARIEQHMHSVSQSLPFWKRVKVVDFWDGDLPRTVTRKVKRREVIAVLQRRRAESGGALVQAGARESEGVEWFLDVVAKVVGKPRAEISLATRSDELGLDSLMFSELAAALEAAGVSLPEDVDFTGAIDVSGLFEVVGASRSVTRAKSQKRRKANAAAAGEISVPQAVSRTGKKGLRLGQELFYQRILESRIHGEQHIPRNVHCLVASNHTSHLDLGLLKVALGETGKEAVALAAADYFFSTPLRRAYFSNFTNLIAMQRTGSVRESLGTAEKALRSGKTMVIFPEGGRSPEGHLRDFLPSLGYLSLRAGVGILPAYIHGTFEAMPKGRALPSGRQVGVTFGPFMDVDFLRAVTAGLPEQDAWKLCSSLTQAVVEGLRDSDPVALDAQAIRAAWSERGLGALPRAQGRRSAIAARIPAASHNKKDPSS